MYVPGQGLKGWASGEDIWAASTIEAFTSLNATVLYTYGAMDTLFIYQAIPDLVKIIIWEGSEYDKCFKRNDANHLETERDGADGSWQTGKKGCIKRTGFEDGIPVWKSFMFHFWGNPVSHLGHNWTLAPEDYARGGRGNYYLGEYCLSIHVLLQVTSTCSYPTRSLYSHVCAHH
jgi:DNA mismatch repair protein MSH3